MISGKSDEFDIGHCPIKVKVKTKKILCLPQHIVSGPIYQLLNKVGSLDVCVFTRLLLVYPLYEYCHTWMILRTA